MVVLPLNMCDPIPLAGENVVMLVEGFESGFEISFPNVLCEASWRQQSHVISSQRRVRLMPCPHFFGQSDLWDNAIIVMAVVCWVDALPFAQFVSPAFEISFHVVLGKMAGVRWFVIIVCV